MGRVLNKKFFGNSPVSTTGGEGIAQIKIVSTGAGYDRQSTWIATPPQIANGITATGTVVVNELNIPTSIVVVEPGSGYTSTASIAISIIPTPETLGTYEVRLTYARQNAVKFSAWVPYTDDGELNITGGQIYGGDIVEQLGTSRYYVTTSQGYGTCYLSTSTEGLGLMKILAKDANSNLYWVTKLESKKARLYQYRKNGDKAWVYNTNEFAKWTFNAATGTNKLDVITCVQIDNY